VMEKMAQSWQARLWSSSKPGLSAHNPSFFSSSHPEASSPIKRFNTRRAHGFIDAACMRVRVCVAVAGSSRAPRAAKAETQGFVIARLEN
jgi:hypothetical protein